MSKKVEQFNAFLDSALKNKTSPEQVIARQQEIFNTQILPSLKAQKANQATINQAKKEWDHFTNRSMAARGFIADPDESEGIRQDRLDTLQANAQGKPALLYSGLKSGIKDVKTAVKRSALNTVGSVARYANDIGENEKGTFLDNLANAMKEGGDLELANATENYQKGMRGEKVFNNPLANFGYRAGQIGGESSLQMLMPLGVAKGVGMGLKAGLNAAKVARAGKIAATGAMGAGLGAGYTQNYGGVRDAVTQNIQRDFTDPDSMANVPLYQQKVKTLYDAGMDIGQAQQQAYAETIDELSESKAEDWGKAITAVEFIAPGAATLGSKGVGRAIGQSAVDRLTGLAATRAAVQQAAKRGTKSGIDLSLAGNRASLNMMGRQGLEEGLQGGMENYAGQDASADIGGKSVDWKEVGKQAALEGAMGAVMGSGMQIASGHTPGKEAQHIADSINQQQAAVTAAYPQARANLQAAVQSGDQMAIEDAQMELQSIHGVAGQLSEQLNHYQIPASPELQSILDEIGQASSQPEQTQPSQNYPALPAPAMDVAPDGTVRTSEQRSAEINREQDRRARGDTVLDITPIPRQGQDAYPLATQGQRDVQLFEQSPEYRIRDVTPVDPDAHPALPAPTPNPDYTVAQDGTVRPAPDFIAGNYGSVQPNKAQQPVNPEFEQTSPIAQPPVQPEANTDAPAASDEDFSITRIKPFTPASDAAPASNPEPTQITPAAEPAPKKGLAGVVERAQQRTLGQQADLKQAYFDARLSGDDNAANQILQHAITERKIPMQTLQAWRNEIEPQIQQQQQQRYADYQQSLLDHAKNTVAPKPEEMTTAQIIDHGMQNISQAMNEGARDQVAEYIQQGKVERLTYTKPDAVQQALANPNYNVQQNENGSVTVIGVKTSDGQWVGANPEQVQDPAITAKPPVFSKPAKANEYLRTNGLTDTHEAIANDDGLFEIKPKQAHHQPNTQTTEGSTSIDPDAMQSGDIGRKSDGQPFANKGAATLYQSKNGLKESHEIVRLGKAHHYVLRPKPANQKTNQSAGRTDEAINVDAADKFFKKIGFKPIADDLWYKTEGGELAWRIAPTFDGQGLMLQAVEDGQAYDELRINFNDMSRSDAKTYQKIAAEFDDHIRNLGEQDNNIDNSQNINRISENVGESRQTAAPELAENNDQQFKNNTLFTADKVAAARARLKSRLVRLNSGIDPELLVDGMTIAGAYIESGTRKFADYAKAMISDFGNDIKPYLLSFWEGARHYPELDTQGMSSVEESKAAYDAINTITEHSADSKSAQNTKDFLSDHIQVVHIGDKPKSEVKENGNAQKLGRNGEGSLEGVPAANVSALSASGNTGAKSSGSSRANVQRSERSGKSGIQPGRSLANGQREVHSATGQQSLIDANGGLNPDHAVIGSNVADSAFNITAEDGIGQGGKKTKFRNNVEAIRLLKQLEQEKRQATAAEQKILAKFVGWGGLAEAFRRDNGEISKGWEKEASELEQLLSPDEMKSAVDSSNAAHYTSPEIVNALWNAVQRFGFNQGSVLEPSVGVGNFFGLMPKDMRSSSALHAVELDPITGGIAKHLYPSANIKAPMGFQDYQTKDNYFDLAIGNPPFGRLAITDPIRRQISGLSIHNYFFAKSIDSLKPNGVLAMVVTSRMLDTAGDKARQYIAEKTEFLGAIRLPNDAFLANAGTQVTTDLIFLRKLGEGESATGPTWTEVKNYQDAKGNTVPLNEYFVNNPQNMLGEFGMYGSMYSDKDTALIKRAGQDTSQLLKDAIERLPKDVFKANPTSIEQLTQALTKDISDIKIGSLFMNNGRIMVRTPDIMGDQQAESVEFPNAKAAERVKGLIGIRDALVSVRELQLSRSATTSQIDQARQVLNQSYDAFIKEHGYINADANKRLMRDDPSWPQLSALEDVYDRGISAAVAKTTGEKARPASAQKAAIFSKRTQQPVAIVTKVASAKDAMVESLNRYGSLNMNLMTSLYGKSEQDIVSELGNLVFNDPEHGLVPRDVYLSGNVKKKLAQAQEAAKTDDSYVRNVKALQDVIPADIEAVDIEVRAGAHWVPQSDVANFVNHILGSTDGSANYSRYSTKWSVSAKNISQSASAQYGTERGSALSMVEHALSGTKPTFYDQLLNGGSVINQQATADASKKVDEVKRAWQDWIWESDERRERLERLYNDTFNTDVQQVYDGSHLTLQGKVDDSVIRLRPHQLDAVWRIIQNPTTLTDHTVGAGKTFTLIAAVMELRRMGIAKKPLLAVPNHLVGQWAADFTRLYPNANILAATKQDFEKANRKRFFARIANGDYDAIIVAHSSFTKLAVHPNDEAEFIQREIDDLMAYEAEARRDEGKKSRNAKKIADRRLALQEQQKKLAAEQNKDTDNIYWGELGVDTVMVDEAHEFKNLHFSSKMQNVAGLGNGKGSQKASDLYLKINLMQKKNPKSKVVFATGTPISNTMAEMYTMQRYLDGARMEEQGVNHFDAWAKVFGEVVSDWELSPSGKYKMTNRFAKFTNMPELMQRYLSFADVINRDDINRQLAARGETLGTPLIKTDKPINIVVERSKAQADYIGVPSVNEDGREVYPEGSLVWRAENLPKKAEKGADNMLKIMSDARKAALDMRLIDPDAKDNPTSKVNVAVDNILNDYHKWSKEKGAQLVFCDLSTPKGAVAKERSRIEDLMRRADEGDDAAQTELDKISPDDLDALNSSFSVYDDMKAKLIEKGIPANQIAFIHDANTDLQKQELFGKVRSGQIRVLMGSTSKMGAGMNVQTRLVALHHLDAPWRPSDLEQREGRIIRQGNELYKADPDGFEVGIYRYAAKQTLDSRMWQTIESKARFIEQIRKGDSKTRVIEDVSGEAANAAEMKAASSGDPRILEEMDLRRKIRELTDEQSAFKRDQYRAASVLKGLESELKRLPRLIDQLMQDVAIKQPEQYIFNNGRTDFIQGQEGARDRIGQFLKLQSIRAIKARGEIEAGTLNGFKVYAVHEYDSNVDIELEGASGTRYNVRYDVEQDSTDGLVQRLLNRLKALPGDLKIAEQQLETASQEQPKIAKKLKVEWGKQPDLDALREAHDAVIEQLRPKERPNDPQAIDSKLQGNKPLASRNKEPVRGMSVKQARQALIDRFGHDTIVRLETMGKLEIIDQLGDVPEAALNSILAFHGSPYKFDKFSLEHLGRGDGHQLYGFGLYFSDSKAVADFYRQNLATNDDGQLYQVNVDSDSKDILSWEESLTDQKHILNRLKPLQEHLQQLGVLDQYETMLGFPFNEWNGGELYTVLKHAARNNILPQPTIELIEAVEMGRSDKAASLYLHHLGINGLKYAQSARDGVIPSGSSNYVIFDDSAIQITDTFFSQNPNGIEGYYHNGKTVLVASNLTADTVIPAFLHEVGGHAGMQGLMKPGTYDAIMQQFDQMVKVGNPLAMEAKRRAEVEADPAVQRQEYLPYLISVASEAQASGNGKGGAFQAIQRFIQRMVNAIKAWAVDTLGVPLKLNPDDVVALAERMVQRVVKQKDLPSNAFGLQSPSTLHSSANPSDKDSNIFEIDAAEQQRIAQDIENLATSLQSYPKPVQMKMPKILLALNGAREGLSIQDLPLELDKQTIRKIMGRVDGKQDEGHQLTLEQVKQLPNELADPVMVLESDTAGGLIVLTTLTGKDGNPVISAIHLNKKRGRYVVNELATAFSKNNFANWLSQRAGKVIYASHKKSQVFVRQSPLQLQGVVHKVLTSGENILTSDDIVKKMGDKPLFSRRAEKLTPEQQQQAETFDKASQFALHQWQLRSGQLGKTPKRIGKFLNTMLHKALTHPEFKKPFDLIQAKINHVSVEAYDSLRQAPELLGHMETGADYLRELKNLVPANHQARKADFAAVSSVVFEGTLVDKKVYSDKALKAKGLTDKQVNLYHDVRAAIETSLDHYARSTLSKIAQAAGIDNKRIMEIHNRDMDIANHHELLKHDLGKATTDKNLDQMADAIKRMEAVIDKLEQLKDEGYAPLMRFGNYFVKITNPNMISEDNPDGTVLRQHYEDETERDLAYQELKAKLPAGHSIEKNSINPDEYKMFAGVSPETVALFVKESGLPTDDVTQQYLKLATAQQSALRRMIHRKGIAGFSEDIQRVLSAFVMSNARYSANRLYNDQIDQSVMEIKDGDLRNEAQRMRDYALDPKEEMQALKNFMFIYYMGASVMFGVINMTQPIMQTMPHLTRYIGGNAVQTMFRGIKFAVKSLKDNQPPAIYQDVYQRAQREGHLDPQNVWMLQGLERGKSGLASSGWQVFSHSMGYIAQVTETVNRRATLFAATEVARSMGKDKLKALGFDSDYDFAIRAIQETQGIYNKGNRPRVARGNVGSLLMMYKQFGIAYVEQMIRAYKDPMWGGDRDEKRKALLLMLGLLFATAGLTGLPFMRDLLDLVETGTAVAGKPMNIERETQIYLRDQLGHEFGQQVADGLLDGPLNLNPVVDIKGRTSTGNMLPGTALFNPTLDSRDKAQQVADIGGATGNLVMKMFDGMSFLQKGMYDEAGAAIAPRAFSDAYKGIKGTVTGELRNERGDKTADLSVAESIVKIIGGQPSRVADEGRIRGFERRDRQTKTYISAQFKDQLEEAMGEGDKVREKEIRQAIKDWNKENPRYPVNIRESDMKRRVKNRNASWQDRNPIPKGQEWMEDYR